MIPTRRSVLVGLIAAPAIVKAMSLDGLFLLKRETLLGMGWQTYYIEMAPPYHQSSVLPGINRSLITGEKIEYAFNIAKQAMVWRVDKGRWKPVENPQPHHFLM